MFKSGTLFENIHKAAEAVVNFEMTNGEPANYIIKPVPDAHGGFTGFEVRVKLIDHAFIRNL